MSGGSGIWSRSVVEQLLPRVTVKEGHRHPCAPHWQQTPTQPPRVEHLSSLLKTTHIPLCLPFTAIFPLSHSVSITLSFLCPHSNSLLLMEWLLPGRHRLSGLMRG